MAVGGLVFLASAGVLWGALLLLASLLTDPLEWLAPFPQALLIVAVVGASIIALRAARQTRRSRGLAGSPGVRGADSKEMQPAENHSEAFRGA